VWVNGILPEEKPKHLLGIGSEPIDFFIGIENGIDTFDCVAPTRMARNGTIYTKDGRVSILRSKYKSDFTPLSEWCPYFEETTYTRAYLAHLFRAKEMYAATLATIINLYFVISLVDKIQESIHADTFDQFKETFISRYYKTGARN
jgi:queuine tRNA-ribosyltransferase